MFDWGKIILIILQIVNRWMDSNERQGFINQGRDEAIAVQTREIFRKTSYGKKVMEEVNALSPEEVDAALVALEPDSDPVVDSTTGLKPVQ